jgi:hypothetical protein
MDDSNLGPVVPRQRGVRDHARSEVLCRHAKLMRNGRPVFCTPSVAELSGRVPARQSRGTDGKVIYPTREAAEAAARELQELGARALRPYVCGRSRRGHYHLTTDTLPRQRTAPAPRTPVDAPPPAPAPVEMPAHRTPTAEPVRITPLHLRIPRQAGPRAS